MLGYQACANCGLSDKGLTIAQYRGCGYVGCTGGFLSFKGCYRSDCPRCGSSKYNVLGKT